MRKIYLRSHAGPRTLVLRRRVVALLRILCGSLCAIDASYRWLAIYSPHLLAGHGSSAMIAGWFAPWLATGSAHLLALWIVGMETVVAGCLLCGALTNLACALGILLALLGIASTGALTMVLGPAAFDLGILLLALLVFLGLGLSNAGQVYGIDGLLARKPARFSTGEHSFSLSTVQPALAHPDPRPVQVADAPRKRQRVLFM